MVVSLDSNWKIPIAYFLINGIDSRTNAGIIKESLTRLYSVGVNVVSVTLDGPVEHFATMRELGATFDILEPKPFFCHPCNKEKVFVIFDPCHMLKLMRNCLGEYKHLTDGDGQPIEWRYVTFLAHLQDREGIRAGNCLTLNHIRYFKNKMKVYLAAQTLSSSVADAIEFCNKQLQLPEFQNSEGTVQFIRVIDRVFDFLNSRNPLARGYKAPLRPGDDEKRWRSRILEDIRSSKHSGSRWKIDEQK